MHNSKQLIVAAAVALTAAVALFARPSSVAPDQRESNTFVLAAIALEAAPGDVLFKSDAGGFWGNMARAFSETDNRFGHVGVIVGDGPGAFRVIHAGGDPVSRDGRVRADSLSAFLAGVHEAALYRSTAPEAVGAAMIDYVREAAARAAPFDREFSLETEDRLYCTELVWRALSAGLGTDASPQKSARAGRVYISLEDLQKSPFLSEIAAVSGLPPEADGAREAP